MNSVESCGTKAARDESIDVVLEETVVAEER